MKNNKYLYQQIFKVVTTIMDMDKKEDFIDVVNNHNSFKLFLGVI